MCGPSNALKSFQSHTSQDRSLQQDRLINRAPQSQVSACRSGSLHRSSTSNNYLGIPLCRTICWQCRSRICSVSSWSASTAALRATATWWVPCGTTNEPSTTTTTWSSIMGERFPKYAHLSAVHAEQWHATRTTRRRIVAPGVSAEPGTECGESWTQHAS